MMSHFTYSDNLNNGNLTQGDILQRTNELDTIIKKIHPYFHDNKDQYPFFQIISQSCDLVRRGKTCKTEHISIAAVRDLDTILVREFKQKNNSDIENKFDIYNSSHRPQLFSFLSSLFNNNNSKYFYLHKDPSHNMHQNYVTTLRVSIALKSSFHYDTLLSSKILELTPEFKSKLGWLVGNLYSRVGTQDWLPDNIAADDYNQLLNEIIDNNFIFVDNPNEYQKLYSKLNPGSNLMDLSEDDFFDFIYKNKLPNRRDILSNAIVEVLTNEGIENKKQRKILAKIIQDRNIAQLLK